jgi:hypothetical protein
MNNVNLNKQIYNNNISPNSQSSNREINKKSDNYNNYPNDNFKYSKLNIYKSPEIKIDINKYLSKKNKNSERTSSKDKTKIQFNNKFDNNNLYYTKKNTINNSDINNANINDEFNIEKCYRNKLQRELNSLGEKLNKELKPFGNYKNKPIVDLQKPELNYNYESFFNSPRKIKNYINSEYSSSFNKTKDSHYFSYNKINYKSPNKKFNNKENNFTKKIRNELRLRKYSHNNLSILSKSIWEDDSINEFEKGKFY